MLVATLEQTAIVVGSDRKWILNTQASLGLDRTHSLRKAKLLSLVWMLDRDWSLPLKLAHRFALDVAENQWDREEWSVPGRDGFSRILIDRDRFLSSFGIRLALAMKRGTQPKGGRPRLTKQDPVSAASQHGIDISLLEFSLQKTASERLLQLDHDIAFLQSIKMPDS